MNETVDAGNGSGEVTGGIIQEISENTGGNQSISAQEGAQEPATQVPKAPFSEQQPIQEGQWMWTDGVVGNGEKPEWMLDKYSSVEAQAKAYKDAERRIGEQNQRLGAFTGAPDKYDFSSIEDESFKFDDQDKTFNQFITECQNGNVSQDFAVKIASLAKNMITKDSVKIEEEAKSYGPSFNSDAKNIKNWVGNNNAEVDANALLESVKTAGAMRALRNLMNSQGFNVPGNEVHEPPRETIKDLKQEFVGNIYSGENLANNPDKIQKWVDKFNKITS
jgi:hypothetical protein